METSIVRVVRAEKKLALAYTVFCVKTFFAVKDLLTVPYQLCVSTFVVSINHEKMEIKNKKSAKIAG